MSPYTLLPDEDGQPVTMAGEQDAELVRYVDQNGQVLWLSQEAAAAPEPVLPTPPPMAPQFGWQYWANQVIYLVGSLVLCQIAVQVVWFIFGAGVLVLGHWLGFVEEMGSNARPGWWGLGHVAMQIAGILLWLVVASRRVALIREQTGAGVVVAG